MSVYQPARPRPKVAIVHYWLVSIRGGEKVLEALCDLYPDADIFTLVMDEKVLTEKLKKHRIVTSFLQKIGGKRHYQKMLPLIPFALESLDLTSYDLVISSEAGPAKGIVARPDALHICYCHSPMRYIWDLYPQYYKSSGMLTKAALSITAPWLRQWDVTTASRVDQFVANSSYVAHRIDKFYRRGSTVINPPVDTSRFSPSAAVGDFYLCAGQITPYKRIDLAIEAFTRLNLPLLVVGRGATSEMKRMAGPTISFKDDATDAELENLFSTCKALIYPGVEDFGIVPLELMASGRPVIAFGRGGATETVIPNKTGLLFYEQTADALIAAVREMEVRHNEFSPDELVAFAKQFDISQFKAKMNDFVEAALDQKFGLRHSAQPSYVVAPTPKAHEL